jgi:hypothetical protein
MKLIAEFKFVGTPQTPWIDGTLAHMISNFIGHATYPEFDVKRPFEIECRWNPPNTPDENGYPQVSHWKVAILQED